MLALDVATACMRVAAYTTPSKWLHALALSLCHEKSEPSSEDCEAGHPGR
jgi:hypothetical protein